MRRDLTSLFSSECFHLASLKFDCWSAFAWTYFKCHWSLRHGPGLEAPGHLFTEYKVHVEEDNLKASSKVARLSCQAFVIALKAALACIAAPDVCLA